MVCKRKSHLEMDDDIQTIKVGEIILVFYVGKVGFSPFVIRLFSILVSEGDDPSNIWRFPES